jgi:hypothetical protein
MEDKCFLAIPGEYSGCRFQEGLGSSFSRESITYFMSWILKHISVVFGMMQLHAILGYFLKHKWWVDLVDRELHFHVTIFLKNCTCRTGINISRKWLDQAPKSIDLYLFFFVFQACDLWLFRLFSVSHMRIIWVTPPNRKFFLIPRHMLIYIFCRKNMKQYWLTAAFSWTVWQHMATHMSNRKTYRDLGQAWFYQPIFNKSWAGKKHHLRWRWIRSVSGFFWWQNWLNLMLVIPGEYGLPALARVTQFIF